MVKLFSINPKVTYIIFIVLDGVFNSFKYLNNIILMLAFDVCVFVLKRIIKKERPQKYQSTTLAKLSGLGPDAYSFPSAHSFSAFQFATFSILTFFNTNKLILLLTAYPILVATSRVKLKHHFLVDVLAGGAMGIVAGVINFLFFL